VIISFSPRHFFNLNRARSASRLPYRTPVLGRCRQNVRYCEQNARATLTNARASSPVNRWPESRPG
jgi:hypothetical protein